MKKEDLFRAVGGIDDALIEEFETVKPKTRWKRLGALAACLCLTAGLVWLGLRVAPTHVGPIAPNTPNVGNTDVPTETDGAADQSSPPALPELPALTFADGDGELAYDVGYPDGYFIREISMEAMAGIWGREGTAPVWEGVSAADVLDSLSGKLIYDGTGRVWQAVISGTLGESDFTLFLSPERLPPTCFTYEGGATCTVHDISVKAVRCGDSCEITFLRGEGESAVGARIEAHSFTPEMEELLTRLVSQSLRPDGVLQLDQFKTDDIPAWRSEDLTETEARAEPDLGAYLPKTPPADYVFEAAHREIGEGRDWLSACWTAGYENLSLTIYRDGAAQDMTYGLVHVDEREKYDLTYYGVSRTGERENVPEEDWYQWHSPCFYAEELTAEVIERRLSEIDMGQVHTNFGVLYPDGTVVRVSVSAMRADISDLLRFLLK